MLASLGAKSRYDDSGDDQPANWFTRTVAFVIKLFGYVAFAVRWVFWLLLWIPTWLLQRFFRAIARVYPGILRASLHNRLIVILVSILLFAGTMALVPRLGTELIPQFSQGEFTANLRLPPGMPLAETDKAIQVAQRAADNIDAVELNYSVAGTGNRLDANPVDAGDNTGTLNIKLHEGASRAAENETMSAMRNELAALAGVQYEFTRPSLLSFSSPLQIEISGYDLDNLARVSRAVVETMSASERFTDIKTTIENGNPEIQIVFDQERAANLGLAVRDIADSATRKSTYWCAASIHASPVSKRSGG